MKFKANHFTFTVKDIDESIKWYSDKLGLKVLTRYDWTGIQIANLKLSSFSLDLFDIEKNTLPLLDSR